MVSLYGETEPFIRNIMTLDTCAPIIGSQVMSYKLEDELLDVIKKKIYFLFLIKYLFNKFLYM